MNDQVANTQVAGTGAVADNAEATTAILSNTYKFRPEKGTDKKRAPLTLDFPVPTEAGIIELLIDGSAKAKQYITELVAAPIVAYVKSQLVEDLEYNQDKLNELLAKTPITIELLANLPRAERSGATKEDFEAFGTFYRELMGTVLSPDGTTPFDQKKVDVAADIFVQRLKPVMAKPDMLKKMQAYLEQFKGAIDEDTATQLEAAIKWFEAKFDELLNAEITVDAI